MRFYDFATRLRSLKIIFVAEVCLGSIRVYIMWLFAKILTTTPSKCTIRNNLATHTAFFAS